MTEIVSVKNMVCHRCVLAVETILRNLDISFSTVTIGEIHLSAPLRHEERNLLQTKLSATGLELIGNRMNTLLEKIKQLVIKKARNEMNEDEKKMKLSAFLSQHLHHEYTYLSHFFSSVEGRSIENYFIEQRIEKVKELLVYNELSLSQIHYELDYSSVAHLSNQFKKVTGLTPSHFKSTGCAKRKMLDKI